MQGSLLPCCPLRRLVCFHFVRLLQSDGGRSGLDVNSHLDGKHHINNSKALVLKRKWCSTLCCRSDYFGVIIISSTSRGQLHTRYREIRETLRRILTSCCLLMCDIFGPVLWTESVMSKPTLKPVEVLSKWEIQDKIEINFKCICLWWLHIYVMSVFR